MYTAMADELLRIKLAEKLTHKQKVERFRSHPPPLGQELLHGAALGAVGGAGLGAGFAGAAKGLRAVPVGALAGGLTGAGVGLGATALERALMSRVIPEGGVEAPEALVRLNRRLEGA